MPELPDLSDPDETPLSPEQDAAVRRLLAESGGPEALPDDIAARLSETLADLEAERAAALVAAAAPVGAGVAEEHGVIVPRDDLARRRRTKARVLLAAAAAVVVGAIATGLVTDRSGSDVTAAEQMAEEDPARTSEVAGDAGALAADEDDSAADREVAPEVGDTVTAEEAIPPNALQRTATDQPLRKIRADRLRDDLVALQHVALDHPDGVDYSGATMEAPDDFRCEPAAFGAGHLVGVEYAGRPAVVAFRAPMGSTQEAEVLACGTGDVLHSTTLATIN